MLYGRKKNLLVSSFGRNINPEWVESELIATGLFAECVVLGDARPYCVALLTPIDASIDEDTLQAAIDQVNTALPDYARLLRWQKLSQPLNQQRQLMTENGRPKRQAIAEYYQTQINDLYPVIAEDIAS